MHLLYASQNFQKNHANLWTFFESDIIFEEFYFFRGFLRAM